MNFHFNQSNANDQSNARDRPRRSERLTIDTGPSPPSLAVVEAVAAAVGTSETELPPLYDAIDADALDALFGSRVDDTSRRGGTIEFRYAGFDVLVRSDPEPDR